MDFCLHTEYPAELEAEWNDLLAHSVSHVPFLRHEYLLRWWNTRGGGEWPGAELALVTARRAGRLVGIAPLFRAANSAGQPALLLLGSIEISDYLDLIVAAEDLDEFLAGLLPFLSAQVPGWQALDLYNLLDGSPTLPALQRAAQAQGWSYTQEPLQHSPHIVLPGDWETYLAGIDKKQRHEIRRKMRRLEESGAAVHWHFVSDPAELDAATGTFIDLMRQDAEKDAFFKRSESMLPTFKAITRCAFERGCLGLALLEINGRAAAGYMCFDYLNRLWVYNSGIDRTMMEYSPGWVLLGYLLQWANEQKRAEFDFMRGDEEYKYRFGAIDRFVLRATIVRN